MSNLGPYQDITVAAKAAGGVDAYLDAIAREAVWKAAPVLLVAGGLGGVVVLGVGRKVRDRWLVTRERAAYARERLREAGE